MVCQCADRSGGVAARSVVREDFQRTSLHKQPASEGGSIVNRPGFRRLVYFLLKITMPMSRHRSRLFFRISSQSRRVLGICLLTTFGASAAQAATNERWVSDTLSTYVRSGPTDGYRIVGTLKSGQKVDLISTQGDYSQVRGEGGGTVWIPNADLQDVPGQAERLPQLTQKVADLTGQLDNIDSTWKTRVQGMQETMDSRKAMIDDLENRTKTLNDQLSAAQSELRSTQAKLGDENNQVLMRYMVYGGSIAGGGLLLGLILPALTRGRKRKDGWA